MNLFAIIHIAKKQCGLTEDEYRELLSGFKGRNGEPATSLTDMDDSTKMQVLKAFEEKYGFKAKGRGTASTMSTKYNHLRGRKNKSGIPYASPEQMRMIEGMFMTHPNVRSKTEKAFGNFLRRIAGVNSVEWVLAYKVKKVVKALEKMEEVECDI